MSFEENKEFDQNINHLIHLLKKMIKNIPHLSQGALPKFSSQGKDSSIQVNFCFFTFLPMSAEDLEEIDELYEQFLAEEEPLESKSDSSFEWNASDFEFLRRHGIQF